MAEHRFDQLSKAFGTRASRRSLLKTALGVAAGGIMSRFNRDGVEAHRETAVAPATDSFQRTWARTDLPVASGQANRTWMWGPEAFTDALSEPYEEAPGGNRTVQYFDKARMEDNSYRAAGPPWDVTNGLLVVELISGRMQLGDNSFQDRAPAAINVAGDANDPNGPTYATFGTVLNAAPAQTGATITQRINRAGIVSNDSSLAGQGVTVAIVDDVTNHSIATPFWEFMNSSGVVYQDGQLVTARLFDSAYFATGRPISEPYWANVLVGGTDRLVLMQCFERRCLTYTPGNPDGFVVEAGNVGQHYYEWRGSSQEGASIGPASSATLEQLQASAESNTAYQQLIGYLTAQGFATTGQSATAIDGSGLTTTDFLTTDLQSSPPNPLHAAVVFDPGSDSDTDTYALVTTAQNIPLYLLSVNSSGAVEPLFMPPHAVSSAASASQLTGLDTCDVCLNACTQLPDLTAYVLEQSQSSCLAVAHAVCGSTASEIEDVDHPNARPIARWFKTCVVIAASQCIQQAKQSTCQEICYYDCATCDQCPGDDPENFCCDGSCTSIERDANNCGACGNRCEADETCCNGVCINILSNSIHCRSCGNSCPGGHDCINGICTPVANPCEECPDNDLNNYCCDGVCLDLLNDVNNCGGCGVDCFEGQTCCDGICLDTETDNQHCGGCGIECPAGTSCINGNCVQCVTDNDCGACEVCSPDGRCQDCAGTCCNNGTCVPDGACCPELITCGGGLCCGGDFPNCCSGFGFCCPGPYPVCCSDNWCCPAGCFCTGSQGCECPGDFAVTEGSIAGAAAAPSQGATGPTNVSYW